MVTPRNKALSFATSSVVSMLVLNKFVFLAAASFRPSTFVIALSAYITELKIMLQWFGDTDIRR